MEKRIVCHISYHAPFDDRIYWKQLLALKQSGYEVCHIAVADRDDDYYTKEGIRIITIKNVKLSRNVYLNKVMQLVSKKSIAAKILERAANIRAHIYQYHDLQVNAVVKKLKKLSHKPKVIYDAREPYFMLWKEKKYANFFSYLFHKSLSFVIAKWELEKASYCDLILTNDLFMLEYYSKKLPSVLCTTIFNYSYFVPDIDVQPKERKFDFIYSGGVTVNRGVREMILAIKSLRKTYPNVTLLIIGPFENDDLKKEINLLIQNFNLQSNIIIKNPVPFSQIAKYYSNASIGLGLFHKTPNFVTFLPIKLFEYMAFGLPVIFCNYGPSAKIIEETNTGILVDPLDIDSVCDAMAKLLSDIEMYSQSSANGIKAVTEKYNWNKEKEKFLAIYEQLLQ